MITGLMMLKAREVMTRDVFTLPASLSLDEAAWALMHRGVSGAPVRERGGAITGVVSNADLVNPERGPDETGAEPRTVADVMTPAVIAVEADDPAVDAVHLMVDHGVHRVLVLGPEGQLLGILTPMDFLRRLLAEGHLESALGPGADNNEAEGDEAALGHH
jgi:CBS-domain-containing membrane protein